MKPHVPALPEGTSCNAVGDLMREAVACEPAVEAQRWVAIQSLLPGRRRARSIRRWTGRLAGPAIAAAVVALWVSFGPRHVRLTYVADGCTIAAGDGHVSAGAVTGGRIVFGDGSKIALDPGGRGRIFVQDGISSARFVLESGAAALDVVHRRETNWVVEAGPFVVRVKGTQFRVSWTPVERHFRLDMNRGEVVVSGPSMPTRSSFRSGQSLDVIDGVRVELANADHPPPGPPRRSVATPERATSVPEPRNRPLAAADLTSADCDSNRAGAEPGRCPAPDTNTALKKDDTMNRTKQTSIFRAARVGAVALAVGGGGLATSQSLAAPSVNAGSPVSIGDDGKLSGAMSGYAWVAAGQAADIVAPSPCNASGCFKDTKGQLCTRGTLPALQCTGRGTPQYTCDWQANWGAMIGMNTTSDRGPWQSGSPATLSVAYHGTRGTYRLTAHVAGDPDSKLYCIDSYQSGQIVSGGMLTTVCWTGSGDTLGDFRNVDKIGLELTSTEAVVAFDYCVSAISVNGTAGRRAEGVDGSHVAIGDNGKLGGELTGYAWVASAPRALLRSPQPCNENGCFKNTQGRLCAEGTIPPLTCTGQGTGQLSCDWQADWGAMIGLSVNLTGRPWGTSAPEALALTFSGPPADYRLMAHLAGTPDSDSYCIEGYQSGEVIDAHMLKSKCWSSSGNALPSYQNVDKLGLQVISAEKEVPVDVCISDIWVR